MQPQIESNMQITEYSQTAAALGTLRERFQNVLFQVTTTKGMKDALAARKELRDLRTGLEKTRKEIKEPALTRCRLIDEEAKSITAQLTALEDPIDAQIKAEEQRKEQERLAREAKERERVDTIRAKIETLRRLPLDSADDSAVDLQATLEELGAYEITEADFAEFMAECVQVRDQVMRDLEALRTKALAREEAQQALAEESARLAVEREELDRRAREIEEASARLAKQQAEHEASLKAKGAPKADPVEAPVASDPAQEEAIAEVPDDSDAGQTFYHGGWVERYAAHTATQFDAMAAKVDVFGFTNFGAELRAVATQAAQGAFNNAIAGLSANQLDDLVREEVRLEAASSACSEVLAGVPA